MHSPGTPKRPKAAINVGDRGSLDFSVLLLLAELLEDRLNRRSAFPRTSLRRFRRRRREWRPQPLQRSLEENVNCSNYCTVSFRFFGNDSSGATSTISDQSRRPGRWTLGRYQHKRENKMKYHHKELGELFSKAQSFGSRVEDPGKDVVIFSPDRTVQPCIAHKSERAFHEPWNPLRPVRERYNTDVTQMIF